ncbi:MAG: alpha/beta hydrolase [Chloroflexi bacterium]|nr:alpha/beta hydrolase [Chloroflexota bacterium]MCC6891414.1 alpha/beta hydrolase [Anaerolineae bacterium]
MDKQLEQAGFKEQRFHTGEINLNTIVGPNNGPALVLIPAQMATWETYQPNLIALSKMFHVYAVDVRGHGKSDWTTGDYSWASVGRDMTAFLQQVVQRPAIVSGNSSGGIIALWLAANVPAFVSGLVLEDAPVFSVEMPRFKEQDRFVYDGLKHFVDQLGDVNNRDLADYFRGQTLPVNEGKREKRMPDWFVNILSFLIRRHQISHPGKVVDIRYFPGVMRQLFYSISTFDPDFSRAFVDGRFYEGLNHAEALKRVTCPTLVMHANWFRHPKYGLVGAMDDEDARHIQELVPQAEYVKIPANHVIHRYKAAAFNQAIIDFAARHNIV